MGSSSRELTASEIPGKVLEVGRMRGCRGGLYGSEVAASMASQRSAAPEPEAVFVSCWHAQYSESAAMWSVYAGWDALRRDGVAVRTTFRRLLESLGGTDKVFAGRVGYHDYERDFVPEDNDFERGHDVPPGILIPVSLGSLVEEIRVAPSAPGWFRALVVSVVERFGLKVPVKQSAMDAEPLH